jgi:hypothetical protein
LQIEWAALPASDQPSVIVEGFSPHVVGGQNADLVNSLLRDRVVGDSADIVKHYADPAESPGATVVRYAKGEGYGNATILSFIQPTSIQSSTGGAGLQQHWSVGSWLLPDVTEIKLDAVAPGACGAIRIAIPWSAMRSGLSTLGQDLTQRLANQ